MSKQETLLFGSAGILCGVLFAMQVSCGTNLPLEVGSIGTMQMALSVTDALEITGVHWSLSHPSGYFREGNVDVTAPEATISTYISGIPADEGYLLALTAETTRPEFSCESEASVDVAAGSINYVEMTLQCVDESQETVVIINIGENICPKIDYLSVSPLVQGVGSAITLQAEVSDLDEEDVLRYVWTAEPDDNAFEDPSSVNTRFFCELGGSYALTLTAADGDLDAEDTCVAFKEVTVTCVFDGECEDGYYSTGRNCADIDECAEGTDDCDPKNGTCTNLDGGYECGCAPHWELNPEDNTCSLVHSFLQAAAGGAHTCGVTPEHTIDCFGADDQGQASPPDGVFTQVTAGYLHTCGLQDDGTAVCFGSDRYGQSSPPSGQFVEISAGYYHTCGVRPDGSVDCWGADTMGQSSPPTGVFTQVSGGYMHTCGIQEDEAVVCWGSNQHGQSSAPSGSFASVSAGNIHTCGITSGGETFCWGNDSFGQASPVSESSEQVVCGHYHSCGLTDDGEAVCWGRNHAGLTAVPADDNFVQISSLYNHTCAVRADTSVSCWGSLSL